MALTPQEELELIEIELEQRRRQTQAAITPEDIATVERSELVTPRPSALARANPMNYMTTPAEKLEAVKELGPAAIDTIKSVAIRGGPAAAGAYVGAAGGPVVSALGAGVGALVGSAADQYRTRGSVRLGETAADTGMGMIPGGSLAKMTTRGLAGRAALEGGANMLANAAATRIDEGRWPGAGESAFAGVGGALGVYGGSALDSGGAAQRAAIINANLNKERAIVQAGRANDFVFPPSRLKQTRESTLLEWLGGDEATANAAAIHNAQSSQQAMKRFVGIKEDDSLSPEKLSKLMSEAKRPFEDAANVSAQAKLSVEGATQERQLARRLWQRYDSNPQWEIAEQAIYRENLADLFENELEAELKTIGKEKLIKDIRDARTRLAKLHAADSALTSDGRVSAKVLGAMLKKDRPLTDEAKLIGELYNTFPSVMRDASSVGSVGRGRLPVLDQAARATSLSPTMQMLSAKAHATPNYEVANFVANFARISAAQKAREKSDAAVSGYMERISRQQERQKEPPAWSRE